MTLNLWYEADERATRHRLAGLLARALDVDVLLVQEVAAGPLDETLDQVCGASGMTLAALPDVTAETRNAVLTRLPHTTLAPIRYTVPESPWDQLAACASVRTPAGRDLLVVSAHLLWGGLQEHRRVLQVEALDRAVAKVLDDPLAPAVLAGDFNAAPTSETLRVAQGFCSYLGRTIQWTDAFGRVGVGPGTTSSGKNPWARDVAARHGFLAPSSMPDRRIDYVLVRGYTHGRLFTPLQSFVVDDAALETLLPSAAFPPSDHYPVIADLWDPAPPS